MDITLYMTIIEEEEEKKAHELPHPQDQDPEPNLKEEVSLDNKEKQL